MEAIFLVKGLIFGFSIAAPVGPIGVLCIRRTLAGGRLLGLVTGMGVATADAFYGCIAGFGLTAISNLLLSVELWLSLIGGSFLCYLGIKTMLDQPSEKSANVDSKGLLGAYLSILLFTIANPITIITFAALFAGLGLASTGGNYLSASLLVIGVFVGSMTWWVILSSLVDRLRSRFTRRHIIWVNRCSGIFIAVSGLLILCSKLFR
jgi:threonine/homoserine/homoserine lactone efflux protein